MNEQQYTVRLWEDDEYVILRNDTVISATMHKTEATIVKRFLESKAGQHFLADEVEAFAERLKKESVTFPDGRMNWVYVKDIDAEVAKYREAIR